MTKNYAPPNYHLLPQPVLNAELLLGSLIKCGPGFRGVGWPDSPLVRAYATRHKNPNNLVLVLGTAAFVWGFNWAEGQNVELSTLNGKRHLTPPEVGANIYEFSITKPQTHDLADILVSSPLRTFYDLLYVSEEDFWEYGMKQAYFLKHKYTLSTPQILNLLNKNKRPHRNRAYLRARKIFDL